MDDPHVHHDALEFPSGQIVKVTRLVAGQRAIVLQLPAIRQHEWAAPFSRARLPEQQRADVARARRRWIREQGTFDAARLVFIDETSANTKMMRLHGRCVRGERLVDHVPQGRADN
jgi:hypothetical protein